MSSVDGPRKAVGCGNVEADAHLCTNPPLPCQTAPPLPNHAQCLCHLLACRPAWLTCRRCCALRCGVAWGGRRWAAMDVATITPRMLV